jgi:hypothetical protein
MMDHVGSVQRMMERSGFYRFRSDIIESVRATPGKAKTSSQGLNRATLVSGEASLIERFFFHREICLQVDMVWSATKRNLEAHTESDMIAGVATATRQKTTLSRSGIGGDKTDTNRSVGKCDWNDPYGKRSSQQTTYWCAKRVRRSL